MSAEPEDVAMLSEEIPEPEKKTMTEKKFPVTPATPRKRKGTKDDGGGNPLKTPTKRKAAKDDNGDNTMKTPTKRKAAKEDDGDDAMKTPFKRKAAKDDDGDDSMKTPFKRKTGLNSPLPKSRNEIQPFDALLIKLRDEKVTYSKIQQQFLDAGGLSSSHDHLRDRIKALSKLEVELDDAHKHLLVETVTEVDAALAKERFVRVAAAMKEKAGVEIPPASLKKTFESIQKAAN